MTTLDDANLPDYAHLPIREGLPKESTWEIFGDRYELGTLNFLTPERVAAAARLARTGRRFNLSLPLNIPSWRPDDTQPAARPSWMPESENPAGRRPYRHENFVLPDGLLRDELVHDFNPQGSSQWDGLGHMAHPRYGCYNGVSPADLVPGDASKLSIGRWAEHGGIIGRGVLLDIPRHFAAEGLAYD